MAEKKREKEVTYKPVVNDYLYYDEPTELPSLQSEEQNIILDFSLSIDIEDAAVEISTTECIIIRGDIKDAKFEAGESVIVNNVYSSKIGSDKDIFILGDCVESIITAKGKVVIIGDLNKGVITGKQVTVIGKYRNNPGIYEIK